MKTKTPLNFVRDQFYDPKHLKCRANRINNELTRNSIIKTKNDCIKRKINKNPPKCELFIEYQNESPKII